MNLEKILQGFMGIDTENTDNLITSSKKELYERFNPNPNKTQDQTYKAIIRFLPNPNKSGLNLDYHSIPEISYWLESDDEKGLFLSPRMVGQDCIIAKTWSKYKKKDDAVSKAICEKLRRRLQYYSLIYIVKDFTNPANTGKVMVYRYGIKVRRKLEELIKPSEEDIAMGQESIVPYDLLNGADFKISAKVVAQWPNYDDCKFLDASPFRLKLDSKDNIQNNSKEVLKTLTGLLENVPNLDELFAYKPWTEEESAKVKRILNYITGESTEVFTSVNNVVNKKNEEPVDMSSDDNADAMDDFLNTL